MFDEKCSECGSSLRGVAACREYLNEMIRWDFEDFTGVGKVHHLTVLSYNLQHPSLYSSKGLEDAKSSLPEFLANPESFKAHDERNRNRLSSDVRDWKITGTPDDHGSYATAPIWKIAAADIVREGLPDYVENVKKWALSVLHSLEESDNLEMK
ncbi:MAG: DUF5946 family protein [Patescibacteria group bacterium]